MKCLSVLLKDDVRKKISTQRLTVLTTSVIFLVEQRKQIDSDVKRRR